MIPLAALAVRAAVKTELSYRNDTIIAFFFAANIKSIKTMLKFLWLLLIVNLRISGLTFWRGTAYLVQNKTTIILPDDTRRTTSELPFPTPATHFWRQIRSLETQNVSCFSLFTIWHGFGNCKSIFVNIQCHLQWKKLCDSTAIPVNLPFRQDSEVFHACWILIDQLIQISGAPAVC